MLKQLYIKNFTLIDELDIRLYPGFSVITGETGAGKSIILGAIGQLLGERADTKLIKNGQKKCIIEARFDISDYNLSSFFEENLIDYDEEDCIIRRELNASGKSRSFINDMPVQLSLLKMLGNKLIDIHSQHQNLLLNDEDFQLQVVDTMAEDQEVLTAYKASYADYGEARRQLELMKKSIEESKKNEDFLRFQFEELDTAALVDGEQEEIEEKVQAQSHAEEIKTALFNVVNSLTEEETGAVNRLRNATQQVGNLQRILPRIAELSKRLDSNYIELKDISNELDTLKESIDFDPNELQELNNRLDTIYHLEHKFNVSSVKELTELKESIKKELQSIDNSTEVFDELRNNVSKTEQQCVANSETLGKLRRAAGLRIEKEILRRLKDLGIPKIRFQVKLEQKSLSSSGADKVTYYFSANTTTPLLPISEVASGGEVSRIMLSLKAMLSNAVHLPTIIFDEIDTGISGHVAEKMGHIMKEMGHNNHQVISITHLPQIAALGEHHYNVSKTEGAEGTKSRMTLLEADERVNEIAKMLSGSVVTDAAQENARELLKENE